METSVRADPITDHTHSTNSSQLSPSSVTPSPPVPSAAAPVCPTAAPCHCQGRGRCCSSRAGGAVVAALSHPGPRGQAMAEPGFDAPEPGAGSSHTGDTPDGPVSPPSHSACPRHGLSRVFPAPAQPNEELGMQLRPALTTALLLI